MFEVPRWSLFFGTYSSYVWLSAFLCGIGRAQWCHLCTRGFRWTELPYVRALSTLCIFGLVNENCMLLMKLESWNLIGDD